MAQDDMFVVMYKIIAYLYDCMKRGEKPKNNEWDAAAMGVPQPYWAQMVVQMVEHGLIEENSMMAKAARFLKDAKA